MELSNLTKVLTAFITDDTNIIHPDVWNVEILKNPITTDTWIAVKGILDGINMYQTKAKLLGFDIMEVPILDKKLLAIKKYLDLNWTEFAHEEKGVYAHNLFMEFLLCYYSRTLIFQNEVFPSYHGIAQEHPEYVGTMKLEEIIDLAFKQVKLTCPDKIKLSEQLRLEHFQCKQFSPMMSDANSYFYILGLVAAQICSKLKSNYLSSHPEMVTSTSGYTPRGYQLEYTGNDPILLSELEVSRHLSSHGDEVENLEFIIEFLNLESKFSPEHVELFYGNPLQFYFDAINHLQMNLIGKIAKNDVFLASTKKVIDISLKSKQAWARRPYVQQLLLEDLQAKIISELEPEDQFSDYESHDEIMEYFDRLVSPNGIKQFMNDTKHEIRKNVKSGNLKLDPKTQNLSNLTLVTPESYLKMFKLVKDLYVANYNEHFGINNDVDEISDIIAQVLTDDDNIEAFINQETTKPQTKIFTTFDPVLFLGEFTDNRKYNFVRESLNKTVFYLNKAASIASETNPNNLLATLISLILFPDKFTTEGAIFAKSKIGIFQSNTGVLQEGDLEIKVTDKVRIFLRDAGHKIHVVFVGNPTYH
jgi:hypothetical protein